MAEYIDLDTPLEAYRLRGNQHDPISTTLRELLDFNKIPYTAADVAPVRHGRWNEESPDALDGDSVYVCSVCGETWTLIEGTPLDNNMHYCPNCGAKMQGDANE